MVMKLILLVFLMASSVVLASCTGTAPDPVDQSTPTASDPELSTDASTPTETLPAVPSLWMTTQLTNVATGESFTINDFKGTPVLVENFAVWCPVCTRQQQESKKLEEMPGNTIVSVSIDSDPNENKSKIRDHIDRNGFDWYYAIASPAVTESMTADFGLGFVQVPLAPMVVVCPDQSTHRLRNGVKSAEELSSSVTELCA
jgi:thiol-disulfide isomerase/thioredoxin